ncbi:MarR family transcriptional regulator [Marinobacter salinisoli]|uniref:MarR family transcriptional regulator n=1 Tax=Marinobacter salinisoli TaxID=2769486 RepID=A0ABX7MN71_9GAMM|nr:MarR family transcriptional regulator [Marinobacter salinisoli]QSP93593.1 MarR family transcriptional regulator [Marinobacter salinisoli]
MAESDNPLALDNQICFALYAANRAMTARYRPLLVELNLTYPQYLVMLVLWEGEGAGDVIRVSDLGHRLRLDSGTLTPLLKRLADRGLIERRRSEQDERVVTVLLTDHGRALRNQAKSVPERLMCGLGVDENRLKALRQELRDVLKSLETLAPSD